MLSGTGVGALIGVPMAAAGAATMFSGANNYTQYFEGAGREQFKQQQRLKSE